MGQDVVSSICPFEGNASEDIGPRAALVRTFEGSSATVRLRVIFWPTIGPATHQGSTCARVEDGCPADLLQKDLDIIGDRRTDARHEALERAPIKVVTEVLFTCFRFYATRSANQPPPEIIAAAFSAIMMTGELVLPETIVGMIDASTTRSLAIP